MDCEYLGLANATDRTNGPGRCHGEILELLLLFCELVGVVCVPEYVTN